MRVLTHEIARVFQARLSDGDCECKKLAEFGGGLPRLTRRASPRGVTQFPGICPRVANSPRSRLISWPAFDVPEFILKRLLKRDAGQLINRLRGEFATRGQIPGN